MCKKKCSKCKSNQSIDNFRKEKGKNSKGEVINYRRGVCETCRNICRRKLYKPKTNLKDKLKYKLESILKTCTKCGEEKEKISKFFHSDKQKIDGFSSSCKACKNKQNIKRQQTKEYKELKSKYDRSYRVGYRKKHKHRFACKTMLRNFLRRMKQAKTNNTHKMLGYDYEKFKQRIEMNFKPGMNWENHGEWHIDHIKPISKFNKDASPRIVNALCNLQPLWAEDNLRKGADFW